MSIDVQTKHRTKSAPQAASQPLAVTYRSEVAANSSLDSFEKPFEAPEGDEARLAGIVRKPACRRRAWSPASERAVTPRVLQRWTGQFQIPHFPACNEIVP